MKIMMIAVHIINVDSDQSICFTHPQAYQVGAFP